MSRKVFIALHRIGCNDQSRGGKAENAILHNEPSNQEGKSEMNLMHTVDLVFKHRFPRGLGNVSLQN